MLPLSLLKTAQRHAVLVELKNGETYNGYLQQCDTWMNLHLSEVICTSKDGQRFFKMPEAYIRGNTIKYVSVPEEVIGKVQEENLKRDEKRPAVSGRGRGGRGWAVGGRGEAAGGSGRGRGEAGRGRGEGGRGRAGGRGRG
ncbi:hypothetical protein Vretimale_20049 [Volvox reticuliferus]|uniref:U6 snRNA-associated Sm-like protein LSm4 n=1 Tax=Volvox reticuliferus TaxID=1737510 RepID=A0A8J4CZM9_9CHLO|nr:hypothetical protein Vretifemale_17713 [Volvox reticuliferus]GIM17503.1 hypothetical protein Vretimale_20049 [Volvox reticuliferus]